MERWKFLIKIAFVCGFNLYYMDASSPTVPVQLTNDGGEQSVLNGVCDWANEEENIKGKLLTRVRDSSYHFIRVRDNVRVRSQD